MNRFIKECIPVYALFSSLERLYSVSWSTACEEPWPCCVCPWDHARVRGPWAWGDCGKSLGAAVSQPKGSSWEPQFASTSMHCAVCLVILCVFQFFYLLLLVGFRETVRSVWSNDSKHHHLWYVLQHLPFRIFLGFVRTDNHTTGIKIHSVHSSDLVPVPSCVRWSTSLILFIFPSPVGKRATLESLEGLVHAPLFFLRLGLQIICFLFL